MNRILEINEAALYAVVEPGVRTADLQKEVEAKGLFYAGDPCSGDSCFIGGNIATNAGGNRAVKYGTTRNQVYAVEVVNPTGKIVRLGARLQKQSTGYCLDQLIIGSEGTLGIITQATLKLLPKPQHKLDLLAIFPSTEQAIGVVNQIIKAGITPTCVEFMDNITIKSVEKYLHETLQDSDSGNYLIVEVEGTSEDDMDDKAVLLDEICTANGASSVLVADSARIWQARKAFAEAVRAESLIVCKEYVVVPVDQEPQLIDAILALAKIQSYYSHCQPCRRWQHPPQYPKKPGPDVRSMAGTRRRQPAGAVHLNLQARRPPVRRTRYWQQTKGPDGRIH